MRVRRQSRRAAATRANRNARRGAAAAGERAGRGRGRAGGDAGLRARARAGGRAGVRRRGCGCPGARGLWTGVRARARRPVRASRARRSTRLRACGRSVPAGASRRAGWRSTMPVDMPRGSADHSPGSSDDGGARERERDARHSGLTDAAPSCRQSWGDFQVRPISPRASASHVWLHSLSLRVSLAPADHAIPRARARARHPSTHTHTHVRAPVRPHTRPPARMRACPHARLLAHTRVRECPRSRTQALLSRVAAAKDAGHSGAAHALETDTQAALKKFDKQCTALVEQLRLKVKEPSAAAFFEESYTYDRRLRGACFVGHINTDLDSVAGAVGAAELFGGVACRSERELNGEVVYALEEVARLPTPPLFDETPGAGVPRTDGTRAGVCLVDHNEPKQMVASLREDPQRAKRIVGLIDHHALAEDSPPPGRSSSTCDPGSMSFHRGAPLRAPQRQDASRGGAAAHVRHSVGYAQPAVS